jgi:phenylalanyl-tRNA synthetase alpha chain
MIRELPPEQASVLNGLVPAVEERVPDLARRLGLDQAQVAAAAVLLSQQGLCAIREEPYREWVLKEPGREALRVGLPERRVLMALCAHGCNGTLAALPEWSGLAAREVGQSLKGLQARGWVEKRGTELSVTETGRAALERTEPDERTLELLVGPGRLTEDELRGLGCEVERARDLIGARSPLVEIREKVHRWISLTSQGEVLRSEGVESKPEATLLTPELLASGEWRNVHFKPYDVSLSTEPRHPGKRHPLQRVIDDTRRVFLQMGFAEWSSPWVESAFWDFDALFQPQDHPAREMQDTFYVSRPARSPLPDDPGLIARVQATHENGGDTGSIGWQYRWNPALAERNVLRTHNTATSIRAVSVLKHGPAKVFSIGRVFRREAIDYKHLPIFFQVDGIIIDADATFSSLLGTMTAFLRGLGFEKVEYRPDFFPYTEPSVGVHVWNAKRRDWFELAGAGIFRPEVTEPLGCVEPVLAWGFGLDRLAMMITGLEDIRELYLSDLEWLKGVPQCR